MIYGFIRNLVHQLFMVLNAAHLATIVYSNKYLSTLCIRKTAYPFKIFIAPSLFIFNILIFFHGIQQIYK
jgi:hypothetical protein